MQVHMLFDVIKLAFNLMSNCDPCLQPVSNATCIIFLMKGSSTFSSLVLRICQIYYFSFGQSFDDCILDED